MRAAVTDRSGRSRLPHLRSPLAALLLALALGWTSSPAAAGDPPVPAQHTLRAEAWWLLAPPDSRRFDASALLRTRDGTWWTVNDQTPGLVRFDPAPGSEVAPLTPVPEVFTASQLRDLGMPSQGRFDGEGLAEDAEGRLYLCEESRRWIVRWTRSTGALERLPIDWSPVARFFHPTDPNASFEGLAIGGGRLYVANERQQARLIAVDLATLKVVDDFAVKPVRSVGDDVSYSDLCWADDSLWVLLRDVHRVLRVDPPSRSVLAEYEYVAMETARPVAYGTFFAPGFMEGLWVDDDALWLLTDNNGFGRRADPRDIRPTLFRCPRPDRRPGPDHPGAPPGAGGR